MDFRPPIPHLWALAPFVLLLLAIATLPFLSKRIWQQFYPHISVGLGAITVVYYALAFHAWHALAHAGLDYLSFMALIGSLFVVAGGIHIQVEGPTTPLSNVLFLALGAILTNLIGTTGASMLLIRPWIRLNKNRIAPYHIVFFIFIISNCSGCLTPIGDPPLFLGFLKGIPFIWTLQQLWPPWLVTNLGLLTIFWITDLRGLRSIGGISSGKALNRATQTWRFTGLHNLIFLGLILIGVFIPSPWREILMIVSTVGSFFLTSKQVHCDNEFNFHPIQEVGWLFLGIFSTMIPVLDYLRVHATSMGLNGASEYYYMCGSLSALLDNAPTYLTFLVMALGAHQLDSGNPQDVLSALREFPGIVASISLGAVFFGAMTYIGNGPNFMVKTISEQLNVPMPGFFSYFFRYSLPILAPLLILIGWLFVH